MSLHGKIPRELLILLSPPGDYRESRNPWEKNIPRNYFAKIKFELFYFLTSSGRSVVCFLPAQGGLYASNMRIGL